MTSPIHAEVRAAVIAHLRQYETDAKYSGDEYSVANRIADRICQAIADALLAALPEKRMGCQAVCGGGLPKSICSNGLCLVNSQHNETLDAVTRVIGELKGDSGVLEHGEGMEHWENP